MNAAPRGWRVARGCAAGRAAARRSTRGCFLRRISACSKDRIATPTSGPIRSWTRCRSAKAASSPTSAPAAAGSRCGWRAASDRTARVYAEDVQPQMIEAIERPRGSAKDCKNVTTVLGTHDRSEAARRIARRRAHRRRVPRDGTAGHAAAEHRAQSLKPTGSIGIVNYKKDGGGPGPPMEERVDPEKVIRDARAAGLELRKRENFLRYQHLLTFGLAAEMTGLPRFFADTRSGSTTELRWLVPDERRAGRTRHGLHRARARRNRSAPCWCCSARSCAAATPRARVPAAAAIELVHAASLILDDLPSMDDAPLRRGRRANHLESGEAIAILAAFGLLNLAYGAIARAYDGADGGAHVVDPVGRGRPGRTDRRTGAGPAGDRSAISFETLERIHRGKTGALFVAAAACGAVAAGAAAESIAALSAYAKNLGLAFQIVDDLLDVAGDPARHGQGRPRRRAQDDVRVVQRRRRRAAARGGALRQTADRALAPFGARADRLARALRLRRRETKPVSARRSARRRSSPAAQVARLPRRRRRSVPARAGARHARPGRARGALEPARRPARRRAARPGRRLGLGARLPGLVSGVRDALRPRALSRRPVLSRRRPPPRSSSALGAAGAGARARRSVRQRARARSRATPAGSSSRRCLIYLTFWWRNANAGFGWSAPVWTAFALAVAVGISLLLGHARANHHARGPGRRARGAAGRCRPSPATSWRVHRWAAALLAFAGASALLVLTAADAPPRAGSSAADGRVAGRLGARSSPSTASIRRSTTSIRERAPGVAACSARASASSRRTRRDPAQSLDDDRHRPAAGRARRPCASRRRASRESRASSRPATARSPRAIRAATDVVRLTRPSHREP